MNKPTGTILLQANATYPRHSEASIIQLADGRLLLAWSRFFNQAGEPNRAVEATPSLPQYIQTDNLKAHIAGIFSADGGHTWSDEHVLIENNAGLNVMSPAFARLADGNIALMYSHRDSSASACRMFCRSTDEGKTWSLPQPITHAGYITACHDRLTVLASGRLIAPLHTTEDWHAHYLYVRIAWSDDCGVTWHIGDPIQLPHVSDSGESGCNEPGVVQRADGSLLLILRTAMGTIYRAESNDDGETWHDLRSLEVVAPVAPSLLRRIPNSNDLLLIWNWHYNWKESLGGVRRPLACAISMDDGNSWAWSHRKILEDEPSFTFSYPSCTFVGDEALITYYVMKADEPAGARSLKLMRLPLKWFYE